MVTEVGYERVALLSASEDAGQVHVDEVGSGAGTWPQRSSGARRCRAAGSAAGSRWRRAIGLGRLGPSGAPRRWRCPSRRPSYKCWIGDRQRTC